MISFVLANQDDIFSLVINTFKPELMNITTIFLIEGICRVTFSIAVYNLLRAVQTLDFKTAYILIPILIILSYLSQLFRLSGFLNSALLSSHIKAGFTMLLYRKVSSMTSYQIQSSQIGKITNLLSSDLSALDQRLVYFIMSCSLPVFVIAASTFLTTLVGWTAILGVLIVLTLVPISGFISKLNGDIIKKANDYKDKRVVKTSQMIEGMKYIKLYGWQMAIRRKVQQIREFQIGCLREIAFNRAIERGICDTISNFSTFVMMLIAWKTAARLNFATIFSILEIMSSLNFYTSCCVNAIGLYYELRIIFHRFATIINMRRKAMICLHESICSQKRSSPQERKKGDICFRHFNAYRKEDFQEQALKDIHYLFQAHTLYGITGKVGSGKTTLLTAILGQIPYYSGALQICGEIAYVEQEPILFSDTVRNNILFGRSFEHERYEEAVRLSCLGPDLKTLSEGDLTMVGERGITLSGGQKARLSLARALFADADIYLLDDPISAVDARVGRKIFENCIKPLSLRKTVLLITHQIGYYEACDQVLMINEGSISYEGSPTSLKARLSEVSEITKDRDGVDDEGSNRFEQNEYKAHEQIIIDQLDKTTLKSFSQGFSGKAGVLSLKTYISFLLANHLNYALAPFTLLLFIAAQISIAYYYRTLAEFDLVLNGSSSYFSDNYGLFWGTLALLLLAYAILSVAKHFFLNICILNSTTNIHHSMLEGVLRSPLSFVDQTPSGMLLNKFSNDLGLLDRSLMFSAKDAIEGPVTVAVAIFSLCHICPTIIFPALIIIPVAILFFLYARPAVLGCKQLDLQNKSPIFNLFSQTINGLIQIKINHQWESKIKKLSEMIDRSTKASIAYEVVSRGFAFYLFVITVLLMAIGLVLAVKKQDISNRGQFGVIIIYLINITYKLQFSFRQVIFAESIMVSAQRVQQLQSLNQEASLRTPYDDRVGLRQEVQADEKQEHIHRVWPQNPTITFKDLSARYRQGFPLALKGISFNVRPGEKIGIVGRTGAGKSSIIQALFRIFEPEVGSIYQIDRFDALLMGLHSLRQHISVIPQVPFIFRGTVKQNLDPFQSATEEQLWQALDEVGLSDHIRQLDKQLQTEVSNNSDSFSVGEKQLLCLARALLRQNRFLVLDEATSNVDMKTDAFIQAVLKERFQDTTVITIAHRLNTIAEYDRVIVMEAGRVVEAGAPSELVERRGHFFQMLQNAGIKHDVMTKGVKRSVKFKNIC